MTSTIRVASPQDLLALVPALAGYRPERSLVCLAFREDRIVGVLRYDLPGRPEDRDPLVEAALSVLHRIPDADGALFVAYSGDTFDGRAAPGERSLLRELTRRARSSGLSVRDAFRVARDAWGSALEVDPPAEGRPLELIETSPVADHPALGRCRLRPSTEFTTLPEVSAAEREAVRVARRTLEERHGPVGDATGLLDDDAGAGEPDLARALRATLALADPVTLVEALLFGHPAGARTTAGADDSGAPVELGDADQVRTAWLIRLAGVPICRDAMMLQIAFGAGVGRRVLRDALELLAAPRAATGDSEPAAEEPAGVEYGRLLLGDTRRAPDTERVERGVVILLRAAAAVPADERAGLLCMAAWLVWGLGRGSAAASLLELALAAEPAHGMARLLARYFATGALPEWAFRRFEREREAAGAPCEGR